MLILRKYPSLALSFLEYTIPEDNRSSFKAFSRAGQSIEIVKDGYLQRIYFRVKDKVSWQVCLSSRYA